MTNVAIACQGGGSHTAFTAGVLKHLLRNWREEWELVGLSGTSGGAVNAVTAWYGLVTEGPERAVELLDAVWEDLTTQGPLERATNRAFVWGERVRTSGLPIPRVSPYLLPGSRLAQQEFRELIERYVDFEELVERCRDPDCPKLVVGTVDVNGGAFETFTDEDVTSDAVLASAAVPTLFPAVEMNGHWHWDGLFSQNPPVRDLLEVPADRKPDELWVVQINPQEREGEPTALDEIADRRNELSGNISLNQELRFIETVNEWVGEGYLPEDRFRHTEIRRLELGRALHCSTKFDRSPSFILDLMERGAERAAEFQGARTAGR